MASKKEFVYTVKVDTGDGVKEVEKVARSIDDFEEGIAGLRDELNKAPLGSDKFKKLSKELSGAEKKFEKAKISSQSLGQSLSEIGGPIGTVIQGVKGFGQSLKVLAANPIGAVITAIVVAVTALYKAFTSTKKGAELIERVMAGFSATLDVLRDRVLSLFTSWESFKSVFTVKFWRDTANEIQNEATQAAELTGQLQRLKDQQRELNTERAKQNLLISDAKLKINDENLSYEDRLKALEEVRKEEVKLAQQEEALAKSRFDALTQLANQSDSSAEDLDELAAAEQEYYNKQLASKQKQKELFDQEKALRDRQRAEQQAAAREREAELKALADFEQQLMLDLIEDEDEKARVQLQIQRDADLEAIDNLKTTEEHKQQLREQAQQKYLNSVEDLEEAITQKEKDEADKREANRKAADQKRIDDTIKDLDIRLGLQDVYDQESFDKFEALLLQKFNAEILNAELTDAELLQLEENYSVAIEAAKKKLADIEQAIVNESIATAQNALAATIAIYGEESRVGKAAAIGQALVNTYLGVTEVLKQESSIPSPFDVVAKIINAGTVVASGLAAVKQIRDVKTPTFSEGGLVRGQGSGTSDSIPAMLSNGESVINARSTAMFTPILSALNEAGGGKPITDGLTPTQTTPVSSTPVIKTYVVSGDVSSEVELDRQVKSRSII